jgi:signal transduction histidine kinase
LALKASPDTADTEPFERDKDLAMCDYVGRRYATGRTRMPALRLLMLGGEDAPIRNITELTCSAEWVASFGGPAEIISVRSANDAVEKLNEESFDAALVRVPRDEPRALEEISRLTLAFPSLPVVAITGEITPAIAEQAIRDGAEDVVEESSVCASSLTRALSFAIERRRAASELRPSKEAAESASRSKSVFPANMSHEIRTPMKAILGFADELLVETLSDAERLELAGMVQSSGEHLLTIINDILDFSKIESGKFTVESVPVSPFEVIESTCKVIAHRASEKNVGFDCQVLTPLPKVVQGDPTRMRQVLINLLDNALKFTQEGSVLLLVAFQEDPEPTLDFSVIDSGVGIAPERLEKIFEPFVQEGVWTSRRFGGTGLGLAISTRLAELLGGELVAWSSPDHGAAFRFSVPTGSVAGVPRITAKEWADQPRAVAAVPGKSQRISCRALVVDDMPMNLKLVRRMLERSGGVVTTCENGEFAIDAVVEAERADEPFDIVFMDMQMPIVDGFEATRRLRALGCKTPIVALTAICFPEDRQSCIDAGCDDFLAKPIRKEDLVDKIIELVGET